MLLPFFGALASGFFPSQRIPSIGSPKSDFEQPIQKSGGEQPTEKKTQSRQLIRATCRLLLMRSGGSSPVPNSTAELAK